MNKFTRKTRNLPGKTQKKYASYNGLGEVFSTSKQLQWFSHKAQELQTYQTIIDQYLTTPLASQVIVANYNQSQLLLHVKNSSAATHLRYQRQELAKALREQPSFSDLKEIKIKLMP